MTHNSAPITLVVDDHPFMRGGVCEFLRQSGWQVVEAGATVASGSAVHVVSGSVTALNNLIANSITGYERAGGSVTENYTLFSTVSIQRAGGIAVGPDSFAGAAGFVNAAGGDFRLGSNSQAIDQGIDVGVALDFFGTPRPQGDGFDIGYHEYALLRLFLPMIKR